MFGVKPAIRRYRNKLGPELSKRYGSGPYTRAQVEVAAKDLKLSQKHIQYAYLLFCEKITLDPQIYSGENIDKMQGVITAAFSGGVVAAPIDALLGGSDGGGGGGGGGGE